ncbi:MAG: amidase [Acidobacteriota bacterium]|jgi:aspartyl-tRNA(Asn)/glutamyl-tRNA(Gln) amidotransferase subunit A|nr:amidase [Acidobacteriota bacterium]
MENEELSGELIKLSATKLAAMIRARQVSPVEVVAAHLRQIEQINPKLNAIVTPAPDVMKLAREAESAIMRGCDVGLLHGIPFTVKDTIETKALRTTSGSVLRASHIPDEDAPAVASMKSAGAILLGKTNVPEMAIPYECENPVFGRTNNPHDQSRTSGGSSGGEAAAISACLSPVGLGSDLSGSIRVPAHFCGIVGLKPTTARVSCAGHFPPTVGSLSLGAVIGPMARYVEDLSLLLNVLTTSDTADDAASLRPETQSKIRLDVRGWRVAWSVAESYAPVTDETKQTIQAALLALRDAGLVITDEKPPGMKRAISLWPELFSRVSAEQLREIYAGNEKQAGTSVRAVLAALDKTPTPPLDEFVKAQTERRDLRAALIQWMHATPLMIAPVGAVPAFEHGARRVDVEGHGMSVFRAFGYSRAVNVLGFPSVSVPAGRTREGLPIGIQIIGRPFAEEAVLAAASIIEESLGGWVQEQG